MNTAFANTMPQHSTYNSANTSVPGRNLSRAPQRFALFFGNRGFFPETLIEGARRELSQAVKAAGYVPLTMDPNTTRFGGVESVAEGQCYARWLAEQGDVSGVILCLPNFGDETGAVAALEDAGVPILIVAYPDDMEQLDFDHRRDAYCGKFSVMDVFYQYGIPFTSLEPHVIAPTDPDFGGHLHHFAAVCRVVSSCRRFTIGAVGARTTAFKTVRYDELSLQKAGVTTETLDLSEVISRVRAMAPKGNAFEERALEIRGAADLSLVPDSPFANMVKLSLVLDQMIDEHGMDAMAVRCWIELEKELQIAPCTLMGMLNDRGVAAACELDVANALSMHALKAASQRPATILDWNNNWKEDPNKCILFHCGPVPPSLMQGKGQVIDHPMFAKDLGPGCGWGPNVGRIASMPMSFASAKTEDGKVFLYGGEGRITEDVIPKAFFGCAGVAEIEGLQRKLNQIGRLGYRHHVSITPGHVGAAVKEALVNYLGYQWSELD